MTSNCMIMFCGNRGKKPGLSYFRLTRGRYKRWMMALGFDPTRDIYSTYNFICSDHFNPEDVYISPQGRMMVKDDAVPSLNLGPNVQNRRLSLLAAEKYKQMNVSTPSSSTDWAGPIFLIKNSEQINDNRQITVPTTSLDRDCAVSSEQILDNSIDPLRKSNQEKPAATETNIFFETFLDADDTKSNTSSTTLTCYSGDGIFDNNNIFYLLMFLLMICLSIIQNPALLFCDKSEAEKRKNAQKRRLEEYFRGCFSGGESFDLGVTATPKKTFEYVKLDHNYCINTANSISTEDTIGTMSVKEEIDFEEHSLNEQILEESPQLIYIKKEPEDIEDPLTSERSQNSDLFKILTETKDYILPNKYWTGSYVPGRDVFIFNRWDALSKTYSTFKKVVLASDMTYMILLGKAETEVMDPTVTQLDSIASVEKMLKKVEAIETCLGGKTLRVSEDCQGIAPKTGLNSTEVLGGYCLPCKLNQLEFKRKIKKRTFSAVKCQSVKHKVSRLKSQLKKT